MNTLKAFCISALGTGIYIKDECVRCPPEHDPVMFTFKLVVRIGHRRQPVTSGLRWRSQRLLRCQCFAIRPMPKSFYDPDKVREMPKLSSWAQRAVDVAAPKVELAKQLKTSDVFCAPSLVHGWGVFAGRDFVEGETLHEAPGRLILGKLTCVKDDVFASTEVLDSEDAKSYSILGFGFATLHNHGTDPNAAFSWEQPWRHGRRLVGRFYTLRAIAKGEELLISYGDKWFSSRNLTAA